MASEPQSATPQTIPEVLLSIEARSFWERVYIANLERLTTWPVGLNIGPETIADSALKDWRERFERKVGE